LTQPRTALITGAARRVGAEIARRLAADGWNVIVHYHSSEPDARELAREIAAAGGICDLIQADLGNRSDVETLIEKSVALHGSIECLINNASMFHYDDIFSVTSE
jgi:NAD(P)-dependent dehydrogenase (short-subunit alcohol dehydrogenase family)